MSVGRERLDSLKCGCGTTSCEDPLVFMAKCCCTTAMTVSYFNGKLSVRCHKCEKNVAVVNVEKENHTEVIEGLEATLLAVIDSHEALLRKLREGK